MSRAWGVHGIVLVVVLAGCLALLASNAPSVGLVFAFVWIPFAVVYTAISTGLVAILRPGRGWVALAHALALVFAVLAPMFFVRSAD